MNHYLRELAERMRQRAIFLEELAQHFDEGDRRREAILNQRDWLKAEGAIIASVLASEPVPESYKEFGIN